jgi:beta-phosphoglucomutase-like phosphatase (HAD superfamily)
MPPKLVIFDCDGVLVDTEAIANEKLAEFLSELGLELTRDDCRRQFQGKMIEDVCRHVAELLGQPFDPSLPPRVRQTIEDAVAIDVTPVPGVIDLVHRVAASDISFCVASSGSIPKMHSTLGPVGLLPMMRDVLFSAQDIGRGKTHPDIFLTAAAAMGHRCEDSIVIEDSLSGVQAGVAAGARVLGYAGDPFTDADALQNAGAEIVHRMEDVCEVIGLE